MRLAYLDCFSGISGDMALGALVHAGADLDAVVRALEPVPIEGFLVEREEVEDHGILATRIHVKVRPQGLIRTYSSVRRMLQDADLPAVFRNLDPPVPQRPVGAGDQLVPQLGQKRVHPGRLDRLERDPVDTRRPVVALREVVPSA